MIWPHTSHNDLLYKEKLLTLTECHSTRTTVSHSAPLRLMEFLPPHPTEEVCPVGLDIIKLLWVFCFVLVLALSCGTSVPWHVAQPFKKK